ncbi:hypothetical protein BDV96DRAFT_640331 [Lophiotrema nucula]|uniref:MYND-type domain-containing protein n=1 Tax=Lophiotrema nucula TaxID=690887 RepID=A0A6A5ZTX8_9PLEO|nr:hypothetical protein BDV96DRAFT_640331 [Lophiotrema nucula]
MADNLCEVCPKTGDQRCSRCRQVRYCSHQCQRAAWVKHKLVCDSATEFNSQDRPTPDAAEVYYRRALLFDPEKTKPNFIWLKFKLEQVDGHFVEQPQLDAVGIDEPDIEDFMIQKHPVLDRTLPHTIRLRFRDNFLSDGSKANAPVQSLKTKHDWRGPMVAYAMKGTEGIEDLRESDDLDATDFPSIVSFLKVYGDERPLTTTRITNEDLKNMSPAERAGGIIFDSATGSFYNSAGRRL